MDNQLFLQVTDKNGLVLCINVSKILYIGRSGNHTRIAIEGRTDDILVRDSYYSVRDRLPKWV